MKGQDASYPPEPRAPLREPDAHSFVVQVWFEERDDKSDKLLWRGRITHVGSGKRRHVVRLKSITDFIAAYLPQQRRWAAFWRWLHHCKDKQ